jgi:SNF2 family DNA or RNA helicase
LRPHQVDGIEWLERVKRGLLADSPRSGKTAQLLLAADGPTLVIAPSDLREGWRTQHALWRPDLDMTFTGFASIAQRAPNAHGHMRKTVPILKPDYRRAWGTVIIDEAHMVVNPKANWTGAIKTLKSERLYLATGTPIPNWAHELLMPLRLLFPSDKRFTNKQRWLETWFQLWQPPWGGQQIVFTNGNDGLHHGLTWPDFWQGNGLDGFNGHMLQRDVDLGVPFTETVIEVDMTPSQAKAYRELKRDYITWIDTTGDEVSAWSDGGLHVKLAKCATGLESLTDGSASGSGKFAVLSNLLLESPRSPTLVFCHFRSTVTAVAALAVKLGVRVVEHHGGVTIDARDDAKAAFQRGDVDVLVGTIDTLALGKDLSAARTEVFVEHSWVPWKNDQVIKRAMIHGKTAPVSIFHLWTRGTVDTGMRARVAGKSAQQVNALTAREFRSVIDG